MSYETYLPSDILKPYIFHFAISEAEEEKTYKVLPVTGVVIGFQYKGKLLRIDEKEQQHLLSSSGLTGLNDTFTVFKNNKNTGTVLVYFKEGAAAAFFKQPIHELFKESLSLDHFLLRSELMITEEKLQEADNPKKKIKVVEEFLLSQLRDQPTDSLVLAALALIHKSKGTIRIKELTAQLHTSQSPLEKRFRQVVGTSPKKFASIVRLKHTIQQYESGQSLTQLAYEAGFYDQAHFIKEFKHFTGDTPESFFREQ